MGSLPLAAADARSVVNVLTGFLGSGKTSLLRRLLSSPAFAHCAVLVNELGEVALDHDLLERIDQETIVLRSGCICCGVRSDMAAALQDLTSRRDRGEVPFFDRVVMETTGLADPVPVINTILTDPVLRHHYRVGTVVTTVDAVLGLAQLRERSEARKQAAVADRLVITKVDLVDMTQLQAVRQALQDINAYCRILVSRNDASEALIQMARDVSGDGRVHEAAQWFSAARDSERHSDAQGWGKASGKRVVARPSSTDDADGGISSQGSLPALFSGAVGEGRLRPIHRGIRTVTLTFDEPLDWTAFGVWFSMLLHRYGETILRVKGILNLQGIDRPTVVHGVQHLLHPPVHLSQWPDSDRRSRLVLIGELPPDAVLRRSLAGFNQGMKAG